MAYGRELTIGQMSARTGLSVPTLRFYEDQRLVHPARTAGGQRRYPRSDIRRLSFVRILHEFGLTLSEIAARLDTLPEGRTPTERDWEVIAGELRDVLDGRIARMQRMRDRLTGCIGCGCLSLATCALHNPDDAAAADGPGPQYILGQSA